MSHQDAFPICRLTQEMIVQDEPMGSKDKFWCQLPPDLGGGHWLFKQPRPQAENIEHLAEKIAYEIALLIEVPCARVELAQLEGTRGSISLDVRQPGDVLVHGNEIIAGRVDGYDRYKQRRTSDQTFERIQKAILEVCGGRCKEDLGQFAGFMVLDALIGNTDRHHENWALLRPEAGTQTGYRLAPSFDHASSLGRELRDARRELLIQQNRVGDYLRHGAGAIYLQELGETPISPLELVSRLARQMPEHLAPPLKRAGKVTTEQVCSIMARLPEAWATPIQRQFATALVCEARDLLAKIET